MLEAWDEPAFEDRVDVRRVGLDRRRRILPHSLHPRLFVLDGSNYSRYFEVSRYYKTIIDRH